MAKKLPIFKPDHQAGMKVPHGGSMCANCEYLKDASAGTCSNEYFIEWNGSDRIPGDIQAYCSDWYEPDEAGSTNPILKATKSQK